MLSLRDSDLTCVHHQDFEFKVCRIVRLPSGSFSSVKSSESNVRQIVLTFNFFFNSDAGSYKA